MCPAAREAPGVSVVPAAQAVPAVWGILEVPVAQANPAVPENPAIPVSPVLPVKQAVRIKQQNPAADKREKQQEFSVNNHTPWISNGFPKKRKPVKIPQVSCKTSLKICVHHRNILRTREREERRLPPLSYHGLGIAITNAFVYPG